MDWCFAKLKSLVYSVKGHAWHKKVLKNKCTIKKFKAENVTRKDTFFPKIYISYTQSFLIKRCHNVLSMSVCRVSYHWNKQHIICFAENHKYFITLYRLGTSPFWNVRATSNLGYFVSVTYFDRTENYNVLKFLKWEEHVATFHYILVPFRLLDWFLNKVALVIFINWK